MLTQVTYSIFHQVHSSHQEKPLQALNNFVNFDIGNVHFIQNAHEMFLRLVLKNNNTKVKTANLDIFQKNESKIRKYMI